MKRTKSLIAVVLLFMIIGFATITTSLSINADMELLGNLDDFYIYYSRAVVNGVEDPSIIVSATELDFGAALKIVGTPYVIEYDITNASTAFDAEISINCAGSTEYFEISNEFDSTTPLLAKQTRTGTLTLTKIKTVAGDDINSTVSCSVVATPVERESLVTETIIPSPLDKKYTIGKEVTIGTEKFNIIRATKDTVTLLAKYNLGTDYTQTPEVNEVTFSENYGWEYIPAPKEINIQEYEGNAKTYVNEYVAYIKNVVEDDDITGNLITLKELESLGCTINKNYSYQLGQNGGCENSIYKQWLNIDLNWWTSSSREDDESAIWFVSINGSLNNDFKYDDNASIRPTITISKDALKPFIDYPVGKEVAIETEKFNIITTTPHSVTMLAQEALDTNPLQSQTPIAINFSDDIGWEYTPGPKDIDIQTWSPDIKTYIDEYTEVLKTILGTEEIYGDLITLKELKSLGCTVNSDYSYTGEESCFDSPHLSWLNNDQFWWTKSALTGDPNCIWAVGNDVIQFVLYNGDFSIRPTITIPIDQIPEQ